MLESSVWLHLFDLFLTQLRFTYLCTRSSWSYFHSFLAAQQQSVGDLSEVYPIHCAASQYTYGLLFASRVRDHPSGFESDNWPKYTNWQNYEKIHWQKRWFSAQAFFWMDWHWPQTNPFPRASATRWSWADLDAEARNLTILAPIAIK